VTRIPETTKERIIGDDIYMAGKRRLPDEWFECRSLSVEEMRLLEGRGIGPRGNYRMIRPEQRWLGERS